ncbi:MAG: sugar ABC transporter permease [Anaerolineae bacterium]
MQRMAFSNAHSSGRRLRGLFFSRQGRLSDNLYALFFLAPVLVILTIVIFYPLVRVLSYSVTNASLLFPNREEYIGLENFDYLLNQDTIFRTAVKNTLVFTFFSVMGGFVLGFALALLLNENIPLRNVLRGAALIPWVIPGVIVALMTLYMFNGEVGIINYTLKSVGLIEEFIPWFGSLDHAMLAVIIANVWNQTPFYMLMLLAGLQTRPDELMEAAKIDGAGSWARFRHITLPHLSKVIMIITALMVIWNFNNFDLIWTTTQGGPVNATMVLSVYTYRQAFVSFNTGYASAIAVLWLLGLLAFSYFYIRAMEG